MSKDDGGSAFLYGVQRTVRDGYGEGERVIDENEKGMSLRDYFAAAALPALIQQFGGGSMRFPKRTARVVSRAYIYADAMLKERAK